MNKCGLCKTPRELKKKKSWERWKCVAKSFQQPSPMSSIPIYIKGAQTLLPQLTLRGFSRFSWKNDWQKQSRSVCHPPSFWFSCELKAMGDFHSWPSIIASWNINPQLTVMGQSSSGRRQLWSLFSLILAWYFFIHTNIYICVYIYKPLYMCIYI